MKFWERSRGQVRISAQLSCSGSSGSRGSVIFVGSSFKRLFKSPKEGVALLIVTGTNFGERDSAGSCVRGFRQDYKSGADARSLRRLRIREELENAS